MAARCVGWFLAAMALVGDASAADLEAGKAVYVAQCVACHGAEGGGDGPASAALPKFPADFRTSEFWRTRSDDRIRSVITRGTPAGIMRGFPMAPGQLDDLVAYLHTFERKPSPAP
jgi:mono/diheme cytochrome c family protein